MEDFESYGSLAGSGFEGQGPVETAEEAFFKSVYIAGKPLKIEGTEIITVPGKLQIRGLEYNLEKVHMIITNIRRILSNEVKQSDGRMKNICFSYDLKTGREGKICGSNSAERASNQFCSTCRSQLIVNGIYCSENGQPIKKDGKYVFIFLRAKATKYGNVSEYLNNLFNMDLEPFFAVLEDPEKERKRVYFEKSIINHKRFVTEISVGNTNTNFGLVNIFELNSICNLSDNSVKGILDVSKKIVSKFDEKFNWNKHKSNQSNFDSYTKETEQIPEENQFNTNNVPFETEQSKPESSKSQSKPESIKEKSNSPAEVSFDDFDF